MLNEFPSENYPKALDIRSTFIQFAWNKQLVLFSVLILGGARKLTTSSEKKGLKVCGVVVALSICGEWDKWIKKYA